MECGTCKYSKIGDKDAHCYMFKDKPEGMCMQNTALKEAISNSGNVGRLLLIAAMFACSTKEQA